MRHKLKKSHGGSLCANHALISGRGRTALARSPILSSTCAGQSPGRTTNECRDTTVEEHRQPLRCSRRIQASTTEHRRTNFKHPPPKQARAIHSQTNLRATQHGMNAEIVTTPTGSRGPQCEIPFQGTWNKHARAKPRQHKCTLTTCAIATVHLAATASTCPGAHEKHQGM